MARDNNFSRLACAPLPVKVVQVSTLTHREAHAPEGDADTITAEEEDSMRTVTVDKAVEIWEELWKDIRNGQDTQGSIEHYASICGWSKAKCRFIKRCLLRDDLSAFLIEILPDECFDRNECIKSI